MTIIIVLFLVLLLIVYCKKENFEEVNDKMPKKIFTYLSNDSHLANKENIKNLKLTIPDHWDLIILNEDNMNKYVDDIFILKYKDLEANKFINLISIKVILDHGGIWIDPKINVVDGSYFDRYQTESIYQGYDCSILEFKEHKYINYLKNYIIMATKNSQFLKQLYNKLVIYSDLEDIDTFIEKYIPLRIKIKRKPTKEQEASFIYYFGIYLLLKDGYKYQVLERKEKKKKFYGIKITKTSKRDILNQQIEDYKLQNNLI
jgi:hypothetical protein